MQFIQEGETHDDNFIIKTSNYESKNNYLKRSRT